MMSRYLVVEWKQNAKELGVYVMHKQGIPRQVNEKCRICCRNLRLVTYLGDTIEANTRSCHQEANCIYKQ